jgi:hypothetical protein
MDALQDDRLFEMLFDQLIMSLNEAAMIQMGKIVNPGSGKLERALPQAQGTIDLLRMLQAKTKNNLSEREQQLLNQSVMTLQMNYVYEAELDAKASSAARGGDGAGAEENASKFNPGTAGEEPPQPEKSH